MAELVIGLDIGTSSTKAVAVDGAGAVVAAVTGRHGIPQPRPGWFEQDAQAIWWKQSRQLLAEIMTDELLSRPGIRPGGVSGLGPRLGGCGRNRTPLRPAHRSG